jgi:hypothetical protein
VSAEREKRDPDPSAPDSQDAESWEGVRLELEASQRGLPPGEETISRPIAELVPPPAPPPASPLLARWLLICAMPSLAFSLVSIALSLLDSGGVAQWQGGLLALNCAVILLVLRIYVLQGTPARRVCHWVLSLAGLGASAFVMQAALLRAAVRFIYGPPPPEVLTGLFACGLLGLAGTVMFVECLQGRGWACRSAAAACLAFLAMLVFQALAGEGILHWPHELWAGVPALFWPALGAAALGAGAFALTWERYRSRQKLGAWASAAIGSLLVLGGAAVLGGQALMASDNAAGADAAAGAHRAWLVAALWEAAALLPIALPGAVFAWRQPGSLRKDVVEATQFLWIMVALGVVAMVGVWLPTHLSVDLLHMGLVGAGVCALATGAWLGAKRGDWAGRWILIPTAAVTLAVVCTLGQLQASTSRVLPGGSAFWPAAVTLAWCSLTVGLVFATAGLALKRHRARARSAGRLLWPDTHLLGGLGAVAAAGLLGLLFAIWAGEPAVVAVLRAGLADVGELAGDLLALVGGSVVKGGALWVAGALGAAFAGPVFLPVAAAVLGVILGVHLAALLRARWAAQAVAILWGAPLAAATALAGLYVVRLVLAAKAPDMATPAGAYLASSFPARLMLLGLAGVVLVRLWESLRAASAVASRREPQTPAAARAADQAGAPHERDLAFLVRVGLLAGSLGLGGALLLLRERGVDATLTELGLIAGDWLRAAGLLTAGLGGLAAEWVGYAAAVAMIVIVLLAVHGEALRGRVKVYPLLGLVWVVMVGVLGLGWWLEARATDLPAAPGRLPALAVTGILVLLLALATVTVWVRWWRLRARAADEEELQDNGDPLGAAHSLGSFGLLLVAAASSAVVYSALKANPHFAVPLAQLAGAAVDFKDWLAFGVETARTHLTFYSTIGVAGTVLAAASLAVLSLHFASRHRWRGVRAMLVVLWSAAVLAGAVLSAHVLGQVPIGQWSAARILAAILLAAVLVRALLAIGSVAALLDVRPGGRKG